MRGASSNPATIPPKVRSRARLRAGAVSVTVGAALLAIKLYAYVLTGSAAILSDALESIVNVVAALISLGALTVASWPADRNHPYGHGKVEFVTAAIEGGMISFAALLIIVEAVRALWRGPALDDLGPGMAFTFGAGLVNAALGWFLIRTGRAERSAALIADGKHVMADFWTSAGVVAGLGLLLFTGRAWIDPVVAIAVALQLAWTGWGVVREAAGGLMDEEDPELLREIVGAINQLPMPGLIHVHFLRAIRSGNALHVDAHMVVPEYWTVDRAHELAAEVEEQLMKSLRRRTEIAFHVDPCRRAFCRHCEVPDCPIRVEPFVERRRITFEEAIHKDPAVGAPRVP